MPRNNSEWNQPAEKFEVSKKFPNLFRVIQVEKNSLAISFGFKFGRLTRENSHQKFSFCSRVRATRAGGTGVKLRDLEIRKFDLSGEKPPRRIRSGTSPSRSEGQKKISSYRGISISCTGGNSTDRRAWYNEKCDSVPGNGARCRQINFWKKNVNIIIIIMIITTRKNDAKFGFRIPEFLNALR